jgi:hypothetical protein
MMNDQPMPEAIKELVQNQEVSDDFIRDFDVKPNVILYHTHAESKKQKKKQHVFVKNSEQELHGT